MNSRGKSVQLWVWRVVIGFRTYKLITHLLYMGSKCWLYWTEGQEHYTQVITPRLENVAQGLSPKLGFLVPLAWTLKVSGWQSILVIGDQPWGQNFQRSDRNSLCRRGWTVKEETINLSSERNQMVGKTHLISFLCYAASATRAALIR